MPSYIVNTKAFYNIIENIKKHSPHPHKVIVVGVTKGLNFSAIQSAEKNNIFNIGESRIQETEEKTKKKTLHPNTKLHLIGHLQNNKVARAIKIYHVIQSVDSIKLLNNIHRIAKKNKKKQKIFLQINIAKTPTQKGFKKTEIFEAAQIATRLSHIQLCGVMSIGAHTDDQIKIKNLFNDTKHIQQHIQNTINANCISLSMGMSQDHVLALQAGTTHLRLGTILFKGRHESN